MYVSLLFWLALILPGYAVARLVDKSDTDCGLLGMIGLAYFWAFALLAPVSILCYVLCLPVAVFSCACVAAVLAGIVVIHRRRWWQPLGRLFVAGLGFELALILVDVVVGIRAGGFLSGDAEMHVARIRYLLDNGFTNQSPYLDIPTFFRIYHTNLQHALYAACSQLTVTNYIDTWYVSLGWAKLALAGGTYYFAWCVLGSNRAAWLPTLFMVASKAPVVYILYPNQLAPLWLLPIGLGVAMQTLRSPVHAAAPLKLAGVSFVIGQVHGLYAVFMGLVLAPVFVITIAARLVRRQASGWAHWACVAALLAGAPFLLVAQYWGDVAPPDADTRTQVTPDVLAQNESFREWPSGQVSLKFDQLFPDHTTLRLVTGIVGLAALFALARRREALALAGMAAMVLAALLIPWLCTPLVKILGDRWIALRLLAVLTSVVGVAAAGALALATERFKPRWWARVPVALAVMALAAAPIWSREEHSWRGYLQEVAKPAKQRLVWLRYIQRERAFLKDNIAPGSVVLAHPRDGRFIVMLCDAYVVLPDRAAGMSPTIPQRNRDLEIMLGPRTPWPQRREMMTRYKVDRLYRSDRLAGMLGWTKGHLRGEIKGTSKQYSLLVLDLD